MTRRYPYAKTNLRCIRNDRHLVDAFQQAGLIHSGTARQQRTSAIISDALLERVTPISPRYLFGRLQDFGFQTPANSVAHRHHLRVWRWDNHDASPNKTEARVESWPWPLLVRRAYFRILTAVLQFLGLAQFYDEPACVWLALQKVAP